MKPFKWQEKSILDRGDSEKKCDDKKGNPYFFDNLDLSWLSFRIPSRKRENISHRSREKDNHRLKSAGWDGICVGHLRLLEGCAINLSTVFTRLNGEQTFELNT